jgi:hypothetical protein
MGFAAKEITISAPNFHVATFELEGTTPYVQHRFSKKMADGIKATQEAGSQGKKGKKREPKDFKACYEDAMYRIGTKTNKPGAHAIHAASFRCAMISACRLVGFAMTKAKLGFWILEDGWDYAEPTIPLVKITEGEPKYFEAVVRVANGNPDIRARPMWAPGWKAVVRIKFDQDMFSHKDIAILLSRAGEQVGIGEGRNDSPDSCGQGWGGFKVANQEFVAK